MFQGRVDYAFDVTQAVNGYKRTAGPKHLYIGQFGHAPSTFPGPDSAYVLAQGLAWYDHYLKGEPERHRQVEAGDDRRGNRHEARVVRRAPEDEGDHGRLPRDGAAVASAPSSASRSRRSACRS